jgi:hypothetical protein
MTTPRTEHLNMSDQRDPLGLLSEHEFPPLPSQQNRTPPSSQQDLAPLPPRLNLPPLPSEWGNMDIEEIPHEYQGLKLVTRDMICGPKTPRKWKQDEVQVDIKGYEQQVLKGQPRFTRDFFEAVKRSFSDWQHERGPGQI